MASQVPDGGAERKPRSVYHIKEREPKMNESAIHWIGEGLRVGKYPGSKWLAEKLGVTSQQAQQILTEYKMKAMTGELPGPGPVPPPPREMSREDRGIDLPRHSSSIPMPSVLPPRAEDVNPETAKIVEALSYYEPEPILTPEPKKTDPVGIEYQNEPLHKDPLILRVIRQYALYVGMAIDLALGIVFLLAVSVDVLTAVGMVAMAFIDVLFKVVAFVDGKKWLWFIFMSLTWWASVSFAVVTISSQAVSVTSVSTQDSGELVRLEAKVGSARKNLEVKNALADAVPTGYKSELDVRLKAVTQAEARLALAESELKSFKAPVESEVKTARRTGINAENAFVIIPNVVMTGNLSQRISLIFFGLMFFGLEYTIAWSASPRKKKNG
jgi:uncharacterized membrane protein